MIPQKVILKYFLQSRLKEQYELELDATTLQAIHQNVQLEKRAPDESQERRSIQLTEDSSGQLQATSFKLYNVRQISIYHLLGFVGKETGIYLFEDTSKKIIYALLMLLHEFYPHLRVSFQEQEAKVLFCIAQLPDKQFDHTALEQKFEEAFGAPLPEKQMSASIEVLIQHRVLKRTAANSYLLREKIKNLIR